MHKDLEIDINEEDFEKAMWGFTPASIRNVALHQAGELGWEDVGGLTEVKETLIETLQWPSKVSEPQCCFLSLYPHKTKFFGGFIGINLSV